MKTIEQVKTLLNEEVAYSSGIPQVDKNGKKPKERAIAERRVVFYRQAIAVLETTSFEFIERQHAELCEKIKRFNEAQKKLATLPKIQRNAILSELKQKFKPDSMKGQLQMVEFILEVK